MARQLSRFTPSLMSHDDLEHLYVPRSTVLDKIAHRIEKAGSSDGRNHTLLVGGRGAGKTHVISLAYHRAMAKLDELGVQVAWLDEDPWLILSYQDLLAHIVDRVEPARNDQPGDDLAYYLQRRAADRGPIVVFAENFDQILDQMGDLGQQELRHLLQTHKSLLLVASTTNLAHHTLQAQDAPFYGFMTEERLIPFQRAQAAAMLTNISTLNGDEQLAVYLKTPEANSRLAVVEHLAGGAPRMWATLGTALDVDGLDDLVDHLMATFDDLTPYYQEQLARLSGHQRRVVAALGQLDRPMSTVDLADRLKIDQRSLSKTIHELKERGWVKPCESPFISMLDKRSTYYELAEPLARIAFQIKANRGEPLRVVVDFLKGWFDGTQLGDAASATDLAASYIETALTELERDMDLLNAGQLLGTKGDPHPQVLASLLACDRALEALQQGDAGPYFELGAPLRAVLESISGLEPGCQLLMARWLTHIHALALTGQSDQPQSVVDEWLGQIATLGIDPTETNALVVEVLRRSWTGTFDLRSYRSRVDATAGAPANEELEWLILVWLAAIAGQLVQLIQGIQQRRDRGNPQNDIGRVANFVESGAGDPDENISTRVELVAELRASVSEAFALLESMGNAAAQGVGQLLERTFSLASELATASESLGD